MSPERKKLKLIWVGPLQERKYRMLRLTKREYNSRTCKGREVVVGEVLCVGR